jgi:hypothetical protein
MIPIGGGGFNLGDGVRMGYGTSGSPDYQRGFLKLWLDAPVPDVERELIVRGIARVSPDPASAASLDPGGGDFDHSGQVVMLADVPSNAPLGIWNVYAERFQYAWDGAAWAPQQNTTEAPDYQYQLEILEQASSGSTPFEGLAGPFFIDDLSTSVLRFKPLPKLRFQFNNTFGALRFNVTYPSNRVAIRAVIAEPIDDSIDWAAQASISNSEFLPGTLAVTCVIPAGITKPTFAIVFDLLDPTAAPPLGGPVLKSDFVISEAEGWDVSGSPVAAPLTFGSKAIY